MEKCGMSQRLLVEEKIPHEVILNQALDVVNV